MRRAAASALCAALLAVLAGALAAAPAGAAQVTASADTQPCVVWKKHRKRVVRIVERGGERKRVVRVRHWRTCARRALAPVVTAPTAPPVTPAAEPQPEPEDPSIPRLGVKAEEWSYTLSRPELEAGEIVVELNNQGEDPHNLNLQLADESGPELSLATIGPSGQSKGKFTVPAGEYRLWCSLDEHESRGMSATLVVAP